VDQGWTTVTAPKQVGRAKEPHDVQTAFLGLFGTRGDLTPAPITHEDCWQKMSGGGGNRRRSGLVRQLFARRDLTAHQPEILRELDPVAFLLIPSRADWNRGFMAT
jgi:hypothetical protein